MKVGFPYRPLCQAGLELSGENCRGSCTGFPYRVAGRLAVLDPALSPLFDAEKHPALHYEMRRLEDEKRQWSDSYPR